MSDAEFDRNFDEYLEGQLRDYLGVASGDPVCIKCHKTPEQLSEYSKESTGEDLAPSEYVKQNEGTYNRANGHFYCTPCYFQVGMPLGVAP